MSIDQHVQLGRQMDVRRKLRQLCKETFRINRPQPGRYETAAPIGFEMRIRNDSHMTTRRLVVYLRGTMCEWNSISGGCVYCGFYRATNGGRKITRRDLLSQIDAARTPYFEQHANAIGLYNDGNFFNDREIDRATQMEILKIVSMWPGMQQITVESRTEYLTKQKLTEARAVVGSCILEVATGIDSTSQETLNIASNRGLNINLALNKLNMARELGFKTTALMVFGLPFLLDSEVVNDAAVTIENLLSHNISVDIEAMTIQPGSVLHRLHESGLYRVPWLWSLVELFRRLPDASNVYLSPFSYSVLPTKTPFNCPNCSEGVVRQLFDVFAKTRDRNDLPKLESCCGERWRQAFEFRAVTTALDRAELAVGCLSTCIGSSRNDSVASYEGALPCVE